MSIIQIDKNVPLIPPGRLRYPWDQMEVGDSFYTETNISSAVAHTNTRKKGKYVIRKETPGYRVWRIA